MLAELPGHGAPSRGIEGVPVIDLTPSSEVGLLPRPYNVAQNKLASGQPTPFNRRHSYNTVAGSKPLRSSPLAGPALSSERSTLAPDTGANDKTLPRTASHPDLATLTVPPPVRHARPRTSQGFESTAGPSRLPSPTEDSSGLPDSPSRHSFFLGLEKRRSKRLSVSSPLEVPPVACPPVPEWALQQRSTHIESQRRPKSSHADVGRTSFTKARPKSAHGYPISNGSGSSLTVPVPPLPGASKRESGSSWLTTNAYDTTPRFSRLGLSASNVVLPVSAREHKRLSKTHSSTSIRSTATVTSRSYTSGKTSPTSSLSRSSSSSNLSGTCPSSPNTPSLSLTRSSSASSSDESLRTPSTVPGSGAPSSVSLDITTIVEDDEEQQLAAADPHHIRTFSFSSIWKGTMSRMTSLRHGLKSSRSQNDINSAPERRSDVASKTVPDSNEHHHMEKDISTPVAEHGIIADTVSAALDGSHVMGVSHTEKGDGISKKQGTIRRLWKTISGVRWNRATH